MKSKIFVNTNAQLPTVKAGGTYSSHLAFKELKDTTINALVHLQQI
jgi:hypothetical protein